MKFLNKYTSDFLNLLGVDVSVCVCVCVFVCVCVYVCIDL